MQPERPTSPTDVCTAGEEACLCGTCVPACDDGPLDTTQCNHVCQYTNDASASPPLILYLEAIDGYDGKIAVEFESKGGGCSAEIGQTSSGVYIVWKPSDGNPNCNGESATLDPSIYITRSDANEVVEIVTSCSDVLHWWEV